jgi:GntR family transcriptional repressor for pyruvate dehydrogenase complex
MSVQASVSPSEPLKTLRRERLLDRATEAIKDYILANRLSGGDRLPSEAELARSLGVSRNVIRQAISSLEALGIVHVAQGRGIYVGDVADTDVFRQLASWIDTSDLHNHDFIQVRSIFERGVYELVMERASDEDMDKLESIATAMRDATADDDVHRLHDQFHQALLESTGNRFLMTLGTILYRFFWSVGYTGPHVHRVSAADMQKSHIRVVEMLRRRCRDDIPRIIALHLDVTES